MVVKQGFLNMNAVFGPFLFPYLVEFYQVVLCQGTFYFYRESLIKLTL